MHPYQRRRRSHCRGSDDDVQGCGGGGNCACAWNDDQRRRLRRVGDGSADPAAEGGGQDEEEEEEEDDLGLVGQLHLPGPLPLDGRGPRPGGLRLRPRLQVSLDRHRVRRQNHRQGTQHIMMMYFWGKWGAITFLLGSFFV